MKFRPPCSQRPSFNRIILEFQKAYPHRKPIPYTVRKLVLNSMERPKLEDQPRSGEGLSSQQFARCSNGAVENVDSSGSVFPSNDSYCCKQTLKFPPHHQRVVQKLLLGDEEGQETFSRWFLKQSTKHPLFAENLLWTNEGIFKENGRQNPKFHQYDAFRFCCVYHPGEYSRRKARLHMTELRLSKL